MVVDRIKHTKPASQRTFLDELEPIPYEITEEELAAMDPRMKKILFGIEEDIAEEHQETPKGAGAIANDEPLPKSRRRARKAGEYRSSALRRKRPKSKPKPRWLLRRQHKETKT